MPVFAYTAKSSLGRTVKGEVEAGTPEGAAELLRDRQLVVITIREKTAWLQFSKIEQYLNKITTKEVTFFARQLSVMISATVPIVKALKLLGKQTKNPNFKHVIADVVADVDNGSKLSQAMGKYPQAFDQFFVHMIRAGETTGRLDQVLEYLADQKEKDYDLQSRVRGAMIYPAFIVAVMIIIGTAMMVFVVPRLTSIITESGQELPLATKMLVFTSSAITNYWWLILIVIGLLVFAYRAYAATVQGRYSIDYLKLRLPVMGPLFQRVALTRFAISFSNLLSSGVPVTKALVIVGDIVGNAVYHDLIKRTTQQVEGGNSIASEFMQEKTIPAIVPQMISVGEETGKLDTILQKLAKFYTKELESAIAALTSVIEPLIIVLLGLGGLVMVAGILMPIYSVTNSI